MKLPKKLTELMLKKFKKGFSLIEILVVLGIIIMIALINIPLLRQYQPTLKLKGEARQLASDLRYAQQLALTEQVVHLVRFFPALQKYQIIRAPAGQNETIVKEIILKTPVIFQSITFTNNQVGFNAGGGSSGAGYAIVTNGDKTAKVEVTPSGYIKITDL